MWSTSKKEKWSKATSYVIFYFLFLDNQGYLWQSPSPWGADSVCQNQVQIIQGIQLLEKIKTTTLRVTTNPGTCPNQLGNMTNTSLVLMKSNKELTLKYEETVDQEHKKVSLYQYFQVFVTLETSPILIVWNAPHKGACLHNILCLFPTKLSFYSSSDSLKDVGNMLEIPSIG